MEIISKSPNYIENMLQEAYRGTYKTKRGPEAQVTLANRLGSHSQLRTECLKTKNHYQSFHQCNQTCLQTIQGVIGIVFSEYNYLPAGTGVLIGPNLVLTAARNIFLTPTTKVSNKKIEFTLDHNGGCIDSCGPFKVIDSFVPESYFKTQQDDYALLVLDRFVGDDRGYAGLQAVAGNGPLQTEELLFSGDNGEFMVSHQNTLLTVNFGSGNGIFLHDDSYNNDYLVGIQLSGFDRFNDATWLTIERFNQINEWMLRVKQKIDSQKITAELELVNLNLNGWNIGADGALTLSRYQNGNLGRLFLASNKIGERGAVAIGMDVSWTNLEILVLDDNQIGDFGAVAIANNTTWRSLKMLYLSKNNISDRGTSAIGRNGSWVNLQILRVSNNIIGDDGAAALSSNCTWKALRLLDMSTNKVGDTGALMLGCNTSWTEIETLNLSHNQISDEGAAGLARNLTWTRLQELNLVENKITDSGAKALKRNKTWKNLQKMLLQDNQLTDVSTIMFELNAEFSNELIENPDEEANIHRMDSLFESIMKSMIEDKYIDERREKFRYILERRQTYKLNGGNLQIEGININENAHLHWFPTLKSLDLSGFVISEAGIWCLLQNRTWTRLEELSLSRTQISDKGVSILAKNTSWTNLLSLDLSINRIGNEGAIALASNTTWKNLKTLNLVENGIDDEGAKAIATNKTWVNMESLVLRKNRIGNKGAIELANNNAWVRLKILSLADNNIENERAESLCRNAAWTKFAEVSLGRNPIKLEDNCQSQSNTRKNLKPHDICDDDQEKLAEYCLRDTASQKIDFKTSDEKMTPEEFSFRRQSPSIMLGTLSYH